MDYRLATLGGCLLGGLIGLALAALAITAVVVSSLAILGTPAAKHLLLALPTPLDTAAGLVVFLLCCVGVLFVGLFGLRVSGTVLLTRSHGNDTAWGAFQRALARAFMPKSR